MNGEPIVTLAFHAPAERLTKNQRGHWTRRARLTKQWRTAAYIAGHNHRHTGNRLPLPPCVVRVTFDVPDNRRRDGDGPAPTVSAIVDGLVDAGFWTDDTPDKVATLSSRFVKSDLTLVTVSLWPLDPEGAA